MKVLRSSLLPLLSFFVLPTLLLWNVLWGQNTLIPFDNLYEGLPWHAFREQIGVSGAHNELVSDLVLENFPWKQFAIEQMRQGKLPLWQPNQFSGAPFLAAGQHSMLYPLALLYFLLPIHAAYGWFAHLSLVTAGVTMFLFARSAGLSRGAALISGLCYQGCGFLTISLVFPMMVAGAAWLPLLLAALVHLTPRPPLHRGEEDKGGNVTAAPVDRGAERGGIRLPWVAVGAIAIGMAALAGHIEIFYYTLLVGGLFGLWTLARLTRWPRAALMFGGAGLATVVVGLMLGAAQLVPLYELVSLNWREGSASLAEVRGYAWPLRQAATLVVPDLLGDPSRHDFFNLATRQWEPVVTQQPADAAGNTINLDHVAWFKGTGDWKNYVEGAGYLGVLPLVLAAIGLARLWRTPSLRRARPVALFALALSLLSLLFIFGTPLYALLFYLLPGWSQLHTPFRWIFPLSICVALFAGIGWHLSTESAERSLFTLRSWLFTLIAGLASLGVLGAILAAPGWWIEQGAKVMDRSQLTQWAFGGSATLLVSYQWQNLLHLALALVGSGVALWLLARRSRFALPLAALVIVVDLTSAANGFMPATPVSIAEFTPPAIEWLQERHRPGEWRYTALEKDWKVLNANSGWQYGLEDIRGYDSIIYRPYVDYMRAVSPQTQLDFNRVAPLRAETPPNQALLDHLNVRYLVTDQSLDWENWRLAYDAEVRIYENTDAFPRAYLIGNATYWGLRTTELPLDRLPANPRAEVLLQGDEGSIIARDTRRSNLPFTPVPISSYTPDEIVVEIDAPQGAWLVLNEVDFPGWRVFVRPAGSEQEFEQEIQRADGLYRAVWVNGGEQTVRWKYSPDPVKVGFFGSFLGVALLALGGALWLWGRVYRPSPDEGTARRVARNSFAPMMLQLFNKGVDTVFAAFMARFLGAETLGQYAFAVTVIWTFIVVTNFGLGTLLTRDVARDPEATSRLFNTTLLLRAGLFAVAFPILVGGLMLWSALDSGTLEPVTFWTIVLLAIGLIPSNLADAVTAVFRAYEKFEVPALIATVATFIKVIIGAAVLLAGFGLIGLAATSIITNVVTLVLLAWLMWRTLYRPRFARHAHLPRQTLRDAFPLMVNEFLATAFFRIDQLMLKPQRGNAEAGYYNVAYKFIDGLLILPSAFTLAIFPVMSRYAQGQPDSLLRATTLSLRWLVMIALPIALLSARYAEGIVLLFGGPEFLPQSAVALQLLIWFLPFSFVNSLVQYVLIAAGQQHALTRAYLVALIFNLIANFIAIQRFGLYGAAIVTVLSEIALLIPFYRLMRASVGALPWAALFARPVAATIVALVPLYLLPLPFWLAIPASVGIYAAALFVLRAFNNADRVLIAKFLPARGQAATADPALK